MTQYETKDSGERQEFDSGMKRDTQAGKPRFDLMVPEGVPYEEQLLTRFALLLSRGAEKYDDRNWEQADSREEIERARSSAFRHFFQWFCGERDEDHPAAVIFNMMVVETIERKLAQSAPEEELDFDAIAEQILGDKYTPVTPELVDVDVRTMPMPKVEVRTMPMPKVEVLWKDPEPITLKGVTEALEEFARQPLGRFAWDFPQVAHFSVDGDGEVMTTAQRWVDDYDHQHHGQHMGEKVRQAYNRIGTEDLRGL